MNKQRDNVDDFLSIFDQQEEMEYIDGFGVTHDDLLALAAHYLDVIWDENYWYKFFRQAGGTWERRRMANRRLNAIAEALGDHAFEEVQRRVDEKWRRIFKDAKRGLVCKACGVPQETLWGIDDEMCMECRHADGPQGVDGLADATPDRLDITAR